MALPSLPAASNWANLTNRAKHLCQSARAGDPSALELIGPYFGDPKAIGLQQAQLVLAREYGFSSWATLKTAVERGSSTEQMLEPLAMQFLELVTLSYHPVPDHGPGRFAQAAALLEAHPDIRLHSIHTAAAIGDVAEIDRWLAKDPNQIEARSGPFHWPPLMVAAYARLPGRSTFSAGLRLLERGADPNAHYFWGGQYKFTVLTGVFGEGEGGPVKQPEHPDMLRFARALLEAGADPNDSQAAYNRCFTPDNSCLELLLEYGLGAQDLNNWTDEHGQPQPSETMHFHLIQAIHRGYLERVKLLIDHGVDIDRPDDSYDTRTKGRTPCQAARLLGQEAIAERLLAAGAEETSLTPAEAFQAACMRGDRESAQRLLAASPAILDASRPREMLCDAVKLGNRHAIETMIALGFDLNDTASGHTPLHEAALQGDTALLRVLIDAGADPSIRDPYHFSPPIGWAQHAEHAAAIALLDGEAMDIFTAAARGKCAEIALRLAENPERLNMRFAALKPVSDTPWETDWATPLAYAVLNDRPEAVRYLLDRGADAHLVDGKGKHLLDIARERAGTTVQALVSEAISI